MAFLDLESDNRNQFPVYNKASELRSVFFKKIQYSLYDQMEPILNNIKRTIKIKRFNFFRWNKKETEKIQLNSGFREKINAYFKEDQKILKKIIE